MDRRQSQMEDTFPCNDIWRIYYRAGTILERPGLLENTVDRSLPHIEAVLFDKNIDRSRGSYS